MKSYIASCLLFSIFAFGAEIENNEEEVAKVSETLGHLMGRKLEVLGLKINVKQVLKGIEEEQAHKKAPMSEEECTKILLKYFHKAQETQRLQDRKEAETFLSTNAKKHLVQCLENNKLQYQILCEGQGLPLEKHHCPLIKYQGKYLDGTVFDESQEGKVFVLLEMPWHKALLGMKLGEKRRIYIHPDLCLDKGEKIRAQALATYEVELLSIHHKMETKELAEHIR